MGGEGGAGNIQNDRLKSGVQEANQKKKIVSHLKGHEGLCKGKFSNMWVKKVPWGTNSKKKNDDGTFVAGLTANETDGKKRHGATSPPKELQTGREKQGVAIQGQS